MLLRGCFVAFSRKKWRSICFIYKAIKFVIIDFEVEVIHFFTSLHFILVIKSVALFTIIIFLAKLVGIIAD